MLADRCAVRSGRCDECADVGGSLREEPEKVQAGGVSEHPEGRRSSLEALCVWLDRVHETRFSSWGLVVVSLCYCMESSAVTGVLSTG